MSRQKYSYQHYQEALTAYLGELSPTNAASAKLVFLWGPSAYLLHQAGSALKAKWLSFPAVQFQSLNVNELLEEDDFRGLWEQSSMFDPAPFYFLRHLEAYKKLWKHFALIPSPRTLKNPFCCSFLGEKLALPLQKEKERLKAYAIPCFPPAYKEMPLFIRKLLQEEDLRLTRAGVSLLQEAAGEDLFKLENEVKKLKLIFPAAKQELHASAISPYLGVMREEHAFRLTQLLLQGKNSQAHILCIDLLRRGESAIAILGILTRHIRNSMNLSEAHASSHATNQNSLGLRLPYSVIKSYNQYVSTIDPPRLSAALSVCQQADMDLKSSRKLSEELILARVLEEIAAFKR